MAVKKLKVRHLDGNAKYIGIKLQGKWLEDAGFEESVVVEVKVKKGK